VISQARSPLQADIDGGEELQSMTITAFLFPQRRSETVERGVETSKDCGACSEIEIWARQAPVAVNGGKNGQNVPLQAASISSLFGVVLCLFWLPIRCNGARL